MSYSTRCLRENGALIQGSVLLYRIDILDHPFRTVVARRHTGFASSAVERRHVSWLDHRRIVRQSITVDL